MLFQGEMAVLKAYIKELLGIATNSSWNTVNGFFGAVLTGFFVSYWPGLITIYSGTDPWLMGATWVFSVIVYAIPAWAILFSFHFIVTAPYQLRLREYQKENAEKTSLNPQHPRTAEATKAYRGVIQVDRSWAGLVDEKWFSEQRNLDILLKDGKRFFEERKELLFQRLVDFDKRTRILIVHPEFSHIKAVASMDLDKRHVPQIQTDDCLAAIAIMQKLVIDAKRERDGIDITKRNVFSGYHAIPTYNALFGDERAYIHMYYSKPYRGYLNTFECQKNGKDSIFTDLKDFDFAEILRNYSEPLWNY